MDNVRGKPVIALIILFEVYFALTVKTKTKTPSPEAAKQAEIIQKETAPINHPAKGNGDDSPCIEGCGNPEPVKQVDVLLSKMFTDTSDVSRDYDFLPLLIAINDINKSRSSAKLNKKTNDEDDKYNFAVSLYNNSDFEEALQSFESLRNLNPSDVDVVVYLARTLRKLGRLADSERTTYEGISLDASNTSLWLNLAVIMATNDKLPESISSYKMAFITSKDPSTLIYHIGENNLSEDNATLMKSRAIAIDWATNRYQIPPQ